MDEVADLLLAWGIPELIPNFARNGVTIQSLSALNSDEIKELVPLVGPRALFIRSWKAWVKTFIEENAIINQNIEEVDISSCNISLSDINILQEQETQTTTPPKTISPNKTVIDIDKVELMQLLKDDFEATSLLHYVGQSLPNENTRNLLALVIARNILKVNKNTSVTGVVYNKWCKDIKALFPGERTTTFYIPACVTAQGNTLQARGKLVSQVLNTRRKYQKLGVLDKKSQSPSSSTITSQPVCTEDDTRIQESLMWLEHSSAPWALVQFKWEETLASRNTYLKDPKNSIEEYIKKFPALQKPEGYTLLCDDFSIMHSEEKDKLFLNFPLTKQNLIKLLNNKKSKDTYHSELVQLSNATNEELTNLAAILSLPELISPNVVLLPAQEATAGPSAPKKLKNTNRRWKPSKAEAREAFVTHIKDDSNLKVTLQKRYETLIQKGLTPQPYIAIVGASLSTIKSHFVIINPNTFYKRQNILDSIDTCFKIIWALNAEYSADSYASWYFIQKSFYKLSSPYDKGSTSAESLMTDCNLSI